jgi:Chaperone of endosialidase
LGGKTSTSTNAVSIPPSVLAQYNSVVAGANQTAQLPFQTYSGSGTPVAPGYTSANAGSFVAPVNSEQTSGINATNTAAGEAQPYYGAATGTLGNAQAGTTGINNAATGLAAASSEQVNPTALSGSDINQYLSPYLGDVLGTTNALANQNNSIAQSGALGTAISSGAFGGDRTGIAAANLNQQNSLAEQATDAGILNSGYNTALSTAQQQQGVGLSAGQANRAALASAGQELSGIGATTYGEGANTSSALAGLGAGAQTAGLQGASAQIGAGTVEQNTQQAQDTAQYNQFLQQQSFPYQVGSWLAGISEGAGSLEGSTTTTQQPGGFFSDKRLKHSIRKIGKTYDGQEIYSYKMHGDDRTHIGLIAQKVEKKHPEAVGLAGGYKIVDYGRATEEAANRGHFYSGGVVPLRRKVYADGGSPYDLNGILAQQQSMYAPIEHNSNRNIPAQASGSHQLAVASGSPTPPPSGASNLNSSMGLVNNGQRLYKQFNSPSSQPGGSGVAPSQPAAWSDPAVGSVDGSTPADLSGGFDGSAGYASGVAPAAESAAPAAASAAAPVAADAAASAGAGAAADAGAEAAAALAAEYVAADAGVAAVALAKRGGRIKHRVGLDAGGVPYMGAPGAGTPYAQDDGTMSIPDDQNTNKLQVAGPIKKQPTGLQTMLTMSDPNSAAGIAGSLFSNQGLGSARGGRIKKDDGGDVDGSLSPDDDVPGITVEGRRPDPIMAASGVDAQAPRIDPEAAPSGVFAPTESVKDDDAAPIAAGLKASEPASSDHWWKHAENVVPLLQGLAAMGTAPTKHLGVALAAGLGQGAASYLPAQQQEADIQARQLQNQRTQMQLGMMQGQGGQGGSPTAPLPRSASLNGIGLDPSEIATNTKNRFAVSDVWQPQELSALQNAQRLQMAGLPNTLPAIQAQHQARITNLQTANQQGASVGYDQAYAVASAPAGGALAKMRTIAPTEADKISKIADNTDDADQLARSWASQVGNSAYRYSGREPVTGTDGVTRDKLNQRPILGQVPAGMSADAYASYLERKAAPVDTGAPAKPALGATPAGKALPAVPTTTTAIPGSAPTAPQPAAASAPVGPGGPRTVPKPTPQQVKAFDFSDAPVKPSWLSDPTHVVTPEEEPIAKGYAAKELALKDEANQLPSTQRELVKTERIINQLPNAKTGPGTETMSAVQTALGNMTGSQFTSWLDSNPSAHALLQKQLGQSALTDRLNEMKGAGAQVKLGAQQDNLIINKLSASVEMPKAAIASLMNWQKQDLQYEMQRQIAIPSYIAQGKDSSLFDSYYASPGHKPLTGALSSAAPAGTTLGKPAATATGKNGEKYHLINNQWIKQ